MGASNKRFTIKDRKGFNNDTKGLMQSNSAPGLAAVLQLIAFAIVALAVGIYTLYQKWRKNKNAI